MAADHMVKCPGDMEFRVKVVKLEVALLVLEDSDIVPRTVKPLLENVYAVVAFWDKVKLFLSENLSQLDEKDRKTHDIAGVTLSLFNAALQMPDCGLDNARVVNVSRNTRRSLRKYAPNSPRRMPSVSAGTARHPALEACTVERSIDAEAVYPLRRQAFEIAPKQWRADK